jgi:hypothetical protein
MDYGFTAKIEEEFDEVANGKLKWNEMINDFYGPSKKMLPIPSRMPSVLRAKGSLAMILKPASRYCPHGALRPDNTDRNGFGRRKAEIRKDPDRTEH